MTQPIHAHSHQRDRRPDQRCKCGVGCGGKSRLLLEGEIRRSSRRWFGALTGIVACGHNRKHKGIGVGARQRFHPADAPQIPLSACRVAREQMDDRVESLLSNREETVNGLENLLGRCLCRDVCQVCLNGPKALWQTHKALGDRWVRLHVHGDQCVAPLAADTTLSLCGRGREMTPDPIPKLMLAVIHGRPKGPVSNRSTRLLTSGTPTERSRVVRKSGSSSSSSSRSRRERKRGSGRGRGRGRGQRRERGGWGARRRGRWHWRELGCRWRCRWLGAQRHPTHRRARLFALRRSVVLVVILVVVLVMVVVVLLAVCRFALFGILGVAGHEDLDGDLLATCCCLTSQNQTFNAQPSARKAKTGQQRLDSKDWTAKTGQQRLDSKDWTAKTGQQTFAQSTLRGKTTF
jgi:hypothetical protein